MRNKALEIGNGMLIFANYNHQISVDYDGNPYVWCKEDNDGNLVMLPSKDFPDDEKNELIKNNWETDDWGWTYKIFN